MCQRLYFCVYFCLLAVAGSRARAQPGPVANGHQAVAAADTSRQLIVASGQRKSATFWKLPPGNGYALRFAAPAGGQRQLTSIRVHFGYFGQSIAKGQVRLRVASIAADGQPADDNLLAKERLITEQTLQYLDQPLTLTWPTEHVVVPAGGFFVVLEGVGNAPDEYVIKSPRVVLAGAGNSAIGRRGNPGAAPRPLSTWSIPEVFSAKLTTVPVELWGHEDENPSWQHFATARQVPMLEVGFR